MNILNRRRQMGSKALLYDAEIEYLDSNLSRTYKNYIDTGIIPYDNHTIRFVTSVMFANKQRRAVISNYSNTSNKPSFSVELYIQSSDERLRTYSTPTGSSQNISNIDTVSLPVDTYIDIDATIDFDEKKWYVTYEFNGDQYTFNGNVYNTTYRCVDSLLLFCDHRSDASAIAYPLKMKFMKIIVDDVLTRDYIPVRKGTIGYMYDKVSKKLFGNSGTGNFLLGQDIVPIEYLQSSNTQWIDTGFKPNQDTSVYMTVLIPTSNIVSRFYETRNGLWSGEYALINFGQSDNQFQVRFGNYSRGTKLRNKLDINTIYTLFMDKNSVYLDGTLIGTAPAYTFQCNYNLPLFALNNAGTVTPASDCTYRLYDCKIYDNNVLIRDYIPVRIGTTGYLLDKLTRTLYDNAGIGDFILGPDKT